MQDVHDVMRIRGDGSLQWFTFLQNKGAASYFSAPRNHDVVIVDNSAASD